MIGSITVECEESFSGVVVLGDHHAKVKVILSGGDRESCEVLRDALMEACERLDPKR